MTELYIIRHGQTDSNVRNTYLGHTDIELNHNGLKQAEKLAKKLSAVKFDALYTGPLSRAVQTAEAIVKEQSGLVMTMNYGLTERDFGIWDNLTYDEIVQKSPVESKLWFDNWVDYEIPDGESARQVHERVGSTVDKIIAQNPDKKVAVVTHLGVIRHMIAHLLKMEIGDSWHFTADNCSVSTIRVDGGHILVTGLNCKLGIKL